MARKKVKLAWIPNDSARRATFKKRRKGIMKKVSELSTLCDVAACMIVYGPQEVTPEVWPSVEEANAVLERFRSMPETEQTKKMMNQEKFLNDRIAKTKAQIDKADKENNEAECAALMFRCLAGGLQAVQELDIGTVMSLAWIVEMKMKAVNERIESLEVQAAASRPLPTPRAAPDMALTVGEELGAFDDGMELIRRQGMFGDYNSQMFWPADDVGAVGYATTPVFGGVNGSSSGGGLLQLPLIDGSSGNLNASSSGNNSSSNNNSNGISFNNQSWLEHYFQS